MAGSRRRPFRSRASWVQWVRRSKQRGAKLASSSSDESPERPAKVLVFGGNAAGDADGSPVCIPVFGGSNKIPRSGVEIGKGDVPKMSDGIGEGREEEPMKLGAGGGDMSPQRVVNIGRLRVDHQGQLYVPDSEDEDTGMEAGIMFLIT